MDPCFTFFIDVDGNYKNYMLKLDKYYISAIEDSASIEKKYCEDNVVFFGYPVKRFTLFEFEHTRIHTPLGMFKMDGHLKSDGAFTVLDFLDSVFSGLEVDTEKMYKLYPPVRTLRHNMFGSSLYFF